MTLTVRHLTQSTRTDRHQSGVIGPGEWNEDHEVGTELAGLTLLSLSATATAIDTDALYDSGKIGGFFSDFDCKGATKILLSQSENQSSVLGGGFREALFIQHQDNDVTDYTLIGQKVSNGVRCYVTGKANGSTYAAQYKDFVGGDFVAIGSPAWALRGVLGVAGTAIGYNVGIIDNEFTASQPAAAAAQSGSMAAGQFIVSSKFAASDATHLARGVLVTNLGKSITGAFVSESAGTDGDNGQYAYLVQGELATVNVGAIFMPGSASGNVGTRILYDTNDYTEYDRTGNAYNWIIGATTEMSLNASGLAVTNGIRAGFTGSPADDSVECGDANFVMNFNGGTAPLLGFDANDYMAFSRSGNLFQWVIGSNEKVRIDASATATHTALLVYDVDNNALERVTVGAADSGGAGFKLLRIPN